MKRTVLALITMLVPTSAASLPSYTRYKLFELAACADVVVSGSIASVGSKTFELSVHDVIIGESVPTTINVERFVNWTCAGRWDTYRRGQQVLLFLAGPGSKESVFTILGAGGEGEMPVLSNGVVVRDYRIRDHQSASHQVGEARVEGPLIAYDELKSAISSYRSFFEWEHEKQGYQVKRVWCEATTQALDSYRSSSRTALHLVDETLSSEKWEASKEEASPDVVLAEPGSLKCIEAVREGFSGASRRGGRDSGTGFGRAVAFLGDVDGNGTDDLAVGAPKDSYLGHFHGALWTLFLDHEGSVQRYVEIREQKGGFPEDMNEFAHLGTAIAPLGDLDGDGTPDLALGAPGWDGAEDHTGGVWILFLNPDGTARDVVEIGCDPALRAVGGGEDYGLGESLACLGDLDGDGTLELAMGQDPGFDWGLDHGKQVLIASIASNGDVLRVHPIHDRSDGFRSDYSWFGDALATIGDLDGDGLTELAISDTNDKDGGEVRGAVWIVFLEKDASVRGKQKISDWAGGFEGLLRDWSRFGQAVSPAGDLDDDGTPDLLVGSSEGMWVLFLKRDGTVKSHQEVSGPDGGFTDLGTLGHSIALGQRRVLVVGGTVGEVVEGNSHFRFARITEDTPDKGAVAWALWMLRIQPTGKVESW